MSPVMHKNQFKMEQDFICNLNAEFIVENMREIFQDLGREETYGWKSSSIDRYLLIVTGQVLYTKENGESREMSRCF